MPIFDPRRTSYHSEFPGCKRRIQLHLYWNPEATKFWYFAKGDLHRCAYKEPYKRLSVPADKGQHPFLRNQTESTWQSKLWWNSCRNHASCEGARIQIRLYCCPQSPRCSSSCCHQSHGSNLRKRIHHIRKMSALCGYDTRAKGSLHHKLWYLLSVPTSIWLKYFLYVIPLLLFVEFLAYPW